jgi:hypothetical protein
MLLRRLKAARTGFVEACLIIGLPSLSEQFVSLWSGSKTRSLLSLKLGEQCEPILEGYLVFETPPLLLHSALLSMREAGARTAFSSQIKATDRAVMARV